MLTCDLHYQTGVLCTYWSERIVRWFAKHWTRPRWS